MANTRSKIQPGESATMDSLRAGGGTDVGPLDTTDDLEVTEDVSAGADLSPVVEASIVEAAGRAADLIAAKGYGPSTITIIQYIAANAADTAELNTVIIEQMAARMLAATSPDQVLDPFGTVAGKEMYNRPLYVTGCTFLESEFSEGFPYYVSLSIEDQSTGATQVVTVGGEKLVMQCAVFDMREAWPQMVMIAQADKETKAGFRPLELRAVAR